MSCCTLITDDALQDRRVSRLTRVDRVLGRTDRLKRAAQMCLLVFDRLALPSQRLRPFEAGPLQDGSHLFQREPQELEHQDVLETLQVRIGVHPISGIRSCRLQ